jgi:hypothetical protein
MATEKAGRKINRVEGRGVKMKGGDSVRKKKK